MRTLPVIGGVKRGEKTIVPRERLLRYSLEFIRRNEWDEMKREVLGTGTYSENGYVLLTNIINAKVYYVPALRKSLEQLKGWLTGHARRAFSSAGAGAEIYKQLINITHWVVYANHARW
ncbi:jg4449 [Pararge aegeria aegeria]|uniref:Jg4449 protein n=1 Tax=Pararge aegeria aegeria TaxID=348720 RepID=A0A8S4SB41_9NEOP|nr:jg4449 [Pararge aegeria aegeria]